MSVPKLIDVTPFEPLVIKVHYDGFDWNILEGICNELINTTKYKAELEENDAKSSVFNEKMPHKIKEFQSFYDWLEPIVEHVIKNEWGYAKTPSYKIFNSWVNLHKKHGVTLEHNHGATTLVAATYLKMPKDSGFIQFKDPMEYGKSANYHEELVWDWKTVEAKTGDVLLFPGWLRHRTQQSNTDEERWVLTTNFSTVFIKK